MSRLDVVWRCSTADRRAGGASCLVSPGDIHACDVRTGAPGGRQFIAVSVGAVDGAGSEYVVCALPRQPAGRRAVCYYGRTMAAARRPLRRAGRTDKISISLDRSDLAIMRKRARRLHGGNISAVVAEGVRLVREQEGREALLEWLGDAAAATPAQRESIRAEWRGAPVRRKHRLA